MKRNSMLKMPLPSHIVDLAVVAVDRLGVTVASAAIERREGERQIARRDVQRLDVGGDEEIRDMGLRDFNRHRLLPG